MFDKLDQIQKEGLAELDQGVTDLKALEDLRHRYLGKKGALTLALRETGKLAAEDRPKFGARANEIKMALGEKLEALKDELERKDLEASLSQDAIDVSLPGRPTAPQGRLHLISRMTDELCTVFKSMGFNVETSQELEDEFHNFDALGFPQDHPSRDSQDSYFVGTQLLRTHTSTVQIRVMQNKKPPIRMLAPGRVYRRDQTDATHAPQFHQLEGLAVDRAGKIKFSHLKGTLDAFMKEVFGKKLSTRYRPSYFPFTEPSVEVDVECFQCKGKGCGLCKRSGWIEIMGAGMVDPEVFKQVGYEEGEYAGFAFGMGVERIAMLKYGINDIRLFFENDKRFLEQF